VGCDLRRLEDVPRRERSNGPPIILWNQRWEYDKNPKIFFRALYALAEASVGFRVVIAGRSHRQSAPAFEAAKDRLGDRVVHFGYAEEGAYERLLRQADIVVSTAIHEFFGVAIVEAVYAGCFPVLPDRLSYPELVPQPLHERCLYEGFDELVCRLRWALTSPTYLKRVRKRLRVAIEGFDWGQVGPEYDERLGRLWMQ
jgi:glycosyltransferase involved in cell wall biosynthesis